MPKKLSTNLFRSKLQNGDCMYYKDLCALLDQPYYSSGNQKKKQLQEWDLYIEKETINRKILIVDIYENKMPKKSKVAKNAIYVKYIECILLQYLSEQPGNSITINAQKLWLQLGMINKNFIECQRNEKHEGEKYSKLHEYCPALKNFDINDFYRRCKDKFTKILKTSLNSLQRRYLINYNIRYMITWSEDNELKSHIADDDDIEKIIHTTRKLLDEYGFDDICQVNLKFKTVSFYKDLNENLKRQYGWESAYQVYHIVYNQENIIDAIPKDQLKLQKLMLNDLVAKSIDEQAQKNYEKSLTQDKQIMNDIAEDTFSTKKYFSYSNEYLENQLMLTDYLIKIDNK